MSLSPGTLNFVSYNCRGWNSGCSTVIDLLKICDVCLIQEHWLFKEQLNLLNIDSNFVSVGISGMDHSKLLCGRPYGGCAILYRRSLLSCISRLDSPSNRFCAALIRDQLGSSTLILCVYLPFNDGSKESCRDFIITLGELEGFIDRFNADNIIIAGDFNVDFKRSSANCQHLLNFMTDLDLVSVDQSFASVIDYTYSRDDDSAHSWPDHFLTYRSFAHKFTNFRCLDSGSNLSDHTPLAGSLSINLVQNVYPVLPPDNPSSIPLSHCAWHKATDEDITFYCDLVSSDLPNLPDSVVDCSDPHCISHRTLIDKVCHNLTNCLYNSALKSIPLACQSKTTPGWNSSVNSLKRKANFWHSVWKQAGSPTAGVLHQIKKSSRNRYKYVVRRLKRREQFIRREKMAAALASSNCKDFWHHVHRVNKSKKPPLSTSVDGVNGTENISGLFSSKLQSILNSQDTSDRDSLLSYLSSSLSSTEIQSFSINEECVLDAFSHLKRGKSDGSNLVSDHVIHALPVLTSLLAKMFTAILKHGYMPEQLRNCVLVPIPKGSKDTTISDNYRPIALAPTLSKALEWCILLLFSDQFQTSGLQFGFKSKMSTSLCSGTLKNVVSRYMHEDSPVYACFLDATKAFDLVNHNTLL